MEALFHLVIIWCAVLVSMWLDHKTRLTSVIYFLIMGAILVNVGVLPVVTNEFVSGFSEVGIIIIMFALGFEENASRFVATMKRSWGIAFFGGVVPFVLAFTMANMFWQSTNIAIMCGLAMTSTAVSLTMVCMKIEGLHTSKPAIGILTSAVIEDIASLVLIAMLLPIATGAGDITVEGISFIVLKVIVFFMIVTVAGLLLLPHEKYGWYSKIPILGRLAARHIICFDNGAQTTLLMLLFALLSGLLAHEFGFHPAVGAYMAGLILKEEYFEVKNRSGESENCYARTREAIDNLAYSWIGPVFFVVLGTKIIFDLDVIISVIPETLLLFLAMFLGQIVSSSVAAYYTAGFDKAESVLIGVGMLGRAELAFIVMNIAYIEHQILSQEAFYVLMATSLLLNLSIPIMIKLWKRLYPDSS